MKQQTRVGKILESLNKRRRVFSEAWNIPNNLRDKKHIIKFLSTEASREIKEKISANPEFEDLSNYIDYKSKKLAIKTFKDLLRDNKGSFGILLETTDATLLWVNGGNYRDGDYWAYLIHKDGTFEDIREVDVANYTGKSAKATRGFLIFNKGYVPSFKKPDYTKVDPLDQVDMYGKSSTLFSKTKDNLVNLMKLRKAFTKVKMELTKESVLANAPKVEKALKSGIGVELNLDGETYLLFSQNNSQLPIEYIAKCSSDLGLLTSDDPRDKKNSSDEAWGVFRFSKFFSQDLKISNTADTHGIDYQVILYVDQDTDEVKINKNFKWSKYRGA